MIASNRLPACPAAGLRLGVSGGAIRIGGGRGFGPGSG
jgi:hypothetical protein